MVLKVELVHKLTDGQYVTRKTKKSRQSKRAKWSGRGCEDPRVPHEPGLSSEMVAVMKNQED